MHFFIADPILDCHPHYVPLILFNWIFFLNSVFFIGFIEDKKFFCCCGSLRHWKFPLLRWFAATREFSVVAVVHCDIGIFLCKDVSPQQRIFSLSWWFTATTKMFHFLKQKNNVCYIKIFNQSAPRPICSTNFIVHVCV